MTITSPDAPAKAKQTKPATLDLLTGHCRNGNCGSCRGSGSNGIYSDGVEALWFCICDCHADHPTCRDCGSRDVEVTLEGTCVDVEGCQTAQQIRMANNPAHAKIREAQSHAEQVEGARKAADQVRRAMAGRAASPSPKAVRQPRPARTPRPAPVPQRCHCGCGGTTKGGKFVAGHDARLKGVLVRAARQTPPESGKPATKADAIRAMAELIARGWPRKHVDTKITEQAERLVDQHGIDPLIDLAVARRYGE